MFRFVVKYLGVLKIVPLFPNIFDGFLMLCTYITNGRLLDGMDDITAEVLSWKGAYKSLHKYGGLQFNYAGREIGHIHGNGVLDIRFSRKIKEQLLEEGQVRPHHTFARSGWISFYMEGWEDSEYAIELLRMSYLKIRERVTK